MKQLLASFLLLDPSSGVRRTDDRSIVGIGRAAILRDEVSFLSKAAMIVNVRTLFAHSLRVVRHVHATISAYLFILMPHCGTNDVALRSSLDTVDRQSMKVELSLRYRLWMYALAPVTLGLGTAVLWLRSLNWPLGLYVEGLELRCGRRVQVDIDRKGVRATRLFGRPH